MFCQLWSPVDHRPNGVLFRVFICVWFNICHCGQFNYLFGITIGQKAEKTATTMASFSYNSRKKKRSYWNNFWWNNRNSTKWLFWRLCAYMMKFLFSFETDVHIHRVPYTVFRCSIHLFKPSATIQNLLLCIQFFIIIIAMERH